MINVNLLYYFLNKIEAVHRLSPQGRDELKAFYFSQKVERQSRLFSFFTKLTFQLRPHYFTQDRHLTRSEHSTL